MKFQGDSKFPPLTLASRSPRRATLLRQMGFTFQVIAAEIGEDLSESGDPIETVTVLSARKAEAVLPRIPKGLIIGADTVVVLKSEMLGKPKTLREAETMLRKLSGETHEVFTGFTILDSETGDRLSDVERTRVTFRKLEAACSSTGSKDVFTTWWAFR
jgi:septum formation protein